MIHFSMSKSNVTDYGVDGTVKLKREETRTWLTKCLFLLSALVFTFSILMPVFTDSVHSDFMPYITAVTGLLGVILGFYFGRHNA